MYEEKKTIQRREGFDRGLVQTGSKKRKELLLGRKGWKGERKKKLRKREEGTKLKEKHREEGPNTIKER